MGDFDSWVLSDITAAPTADSLAIANSGPIDFGSVWSGLKEAGSGAINLTKSLSGTVLDWQRNQLQIEQGQAAIDLARTNAQNNQKIAMMQSQYAARMGIMMPTDASQLYGANNITQTLANMQRSLGGTLGQSSGLTTLLVIGGIVLAVMKYGK